MSLLVVGYVFSLRVRGENIALRSLSEIFCEINRLYRDKLRESFAKEAPSYDPIDLAAEEKAALQAVCQRIENIFSRVTRRNCMVTVKLLTKEECIKGVRLDYLGKPHHPRASSACFA
jgi:hypothetical protein